MARILVLNNYPLESLIGEVERRETPDHLLFGINHFRRHGHSIHLVHFNKSSKWSRLNRILLWSRFPFPLGDLDQQVSTLKCVKSADLIYSPCQTQTNLLALTRAMGWLKKPIIALAHHPINRGRLSALRAPYLRLILKGVDAYPALSQRVSEQINYLSRDKNKSVAVVWGPDSQYYPSSEYPGEGVVCAGRTGRDFVTFGNAATQANVNAKIFCLRENRTPAFSGFGPNVEINLQPNTGWMPYKQLVTHYAKARVLAIPLCQGESIVGLSSLLDAFGMGKPVIMTRLPIFDFDVEQLGIGKWVNPGDLEGWKRSLEWFAGNPEKAANMGVKARKYVDEGFNSAAFAQRIMSIINEVQN